MDKEDSIQVDVSEEETASNRFVFSRPSNIFEYPSRMVHFGLRSDHVFDVRSSEKDIFTFAAPTMISQYDRAHTNLQATNKIRKHKSKACRSTYEPTFNVFANALKDTGAFEQLKKNSRSHTTQVNIDHSITCSNVPKGLLAKTAAKEYFMKYGHIVKIAIRPKKHIITVTYTTKEEASIAYYCSGDYVGKKFHIEWTKSEPLKSQSKKKGRNIVANLLKAPSDEIKSELEAMTNLEYNLHSDKDAEVSDTLFPIKARTSGGKAASLHEKLTSKLEKAVAKAEKLETESRIIKPVPVTSVEELQNIIHQIALTAEDKYKVLEARDRLMRLKRVKPASLATAKVTSGTCPDMCPEKERLMRESQRQVASYELLEGNEYRINHATAIKQYSRSSADQEEPMPHELRPVKSLKMTMSFLLHEIVHLCEKEGTNLAEWYHFLWDRTRGIRKDITQQELCCVDSVELIEQCARFHIVCSERLCAEDVSVFDKKINSENLTKCLQTLKYMYHDLRMKGIFCENEPEFRAYVVLLNLNNGNFLYDMQQLPKSIQDSPEVQFAIDVYFALDSNNYYKFFKLVRETTYLNACILLRYFNQVRTKALSVMVKAYCRTTSTAFPLYELIDILGFEDENETKYFCEQVGLSLSKDELYILLNRQNFSMPAVNIQQGRACNLIESKRIALNFSIGQCIAGGEMPDKTYKNHKPHNSFDANGNLMPESINAADQNFDVSSVELGEFAERETKKIAKSTGSNRDKTQVSTSLTQIRKQTTNASNGTSVFKPIPVSEATCLSVDKAVTSKPDVSTHQKVTNVFENKPIVQPKIISDTIPITRHSDQENTVAEVTIYRESVGGEQPTIFDNNTIDSVVFRQAITEQPEASRDAESVTPFAMAVNKSIFSGVDSGNIFMKNVNSPSTIFAGNRSHLSVSVQQSPNDTNAASKAIVEQCVSPKKKRAQRDAQPISDAERARLEKLEHAKKIRCIERQSEEIYDNVHAEVTREFCRTIAREEIDRMKMHDMLSESIATDTIDEVAREMCDAILSVEIDSRRRLQAMSLRIRNRVIARYFIAWRRYVTKRRRQRQALEDTPVWLQKRSVEECAKMLHSREQELAIQNMRKRRLEQEDATSGTENLAPIEFIVHAGIRENLRLLDINPATNVFWKLVISWPDLGNRAVFWHYKKMMNEYLYPDDFTMEPIVKIYRPNLYEIVHVCIRHFEGLISEHNLVGADALLFIADASEDRKSVAKRLTRTILSRHKLMPIPLTFIVLGNGNLENQNESIVSDLESFLESGYVSEYTIMFEKNLTTKVISNLTQSAILWLTMNRSPSNPLEMDHLRNIFDICLSEELWLR